MNAWLITWEGTDKKLNDSNKIVGVVSSRCSSKNIENLIDFLYQRTIFNVGEMTYFANRKSARKKMNRSLLSTESRIFYGNNPYLFARLVENLSVVEKEYTEIITWTEPALYGNDPDNNYQVTQLQPESKKSITRPKNMLLTMELTVA